MISLEQRIADLMAMDEDRRWEALIEWIHDIERRVKNMDEEDLR